MISPQKNNNSFDFAYRIIDDLISPHFPTLNSILADHPNQYFRLYKSCLEVL